MATVSSTVELLIKAQQPQRALRALSDSTNKLKNSIDATQGAFNKTGQSASKSAAKASTAYKSLGTEVSGVNNIVRTLRNSFVALGGAVTASGILQTGVDAIEAERKIKLLSMTTGDSAEALAIASRAASRFGLSSTEANEGVARLLARLRPMGLGLEEIESTFNGFNIASKLAGATASESAGAFLQLTQALGSGVLRGQELNSILEQAPLIATAIALEMNTTTGSLKKLGEEGKITSKIVLAALKKVESEGAEKLEEAMRGPAQQFRNLRNQGIELAKVLTENVLPAILPLVKGATDLLKSFNKLPPGIQSFVISVGAAGTAVFTLTRLIKLLALTKLGTFLAQQAALFQVFGAKIYFSAAAAGVLKVALAALPFAGVTLALGLFVNKLAEAARKQREFNELVNFGSEEQLRSAIATRIQTRATIENTIAKLKAQKPFMAEFGAITQLQEIQGLEQDLKDLDKEFAKISLKLMDLEAARRKAAQATNDPLGDREDMSARMLDLNNQLRAAQDAEQHSIAATLKLMIKKQEIAEGELLPREKENALAQAYRDFRKEILGIDKKIADQRSSEIEEAMESFSDQLAHQDELNHLLLQQNDIFAQIGQTIEDGLVQGLTDAITGAKSLGEALSGVLKSVGSMFLRQGISSLIGSIGGGGGGGFGVTPLTSGMNFFSAEGSYASGATNAVIGEAEPEYVIPESKMRESMARYARGARGSAVIPENGEGGTNSEGGGVSASTLDVRFNVERINSVDYVTASEFQAGIAQAAKKGAAEGERRAIGSMRNSPAVRRRVGV